MERRVFVVLVLLSSLASRSTTFGTPYDDEIFLPLVNTSHATFNVSAKKEGRCVNLEAVIALAQRWMPSPLVDQLQFEALQPVKTNQNKNVHCNKDRDPCSCTPDTFEYESLVQNENNNKTPQKRIAIRGTSTAALTAALGWYLKYEAHVHISWTGDQLLLFQNTTNTNSTLLPLPPHKVQHVRQGPYSYYQNVCTVSYSMAWWDLPRWHRELDWMALSGINFPLAFIGQEAVWFSVFTSLGISQNDVLTWLGGPGFMAWQRMGNIQAWAGPMPQSWITSQHSLQLGILARARELGMIPILPAFAGFVPPQLQTLFPKANISTNHPWSSFNTSYTPVHYLEPTDALFKTLGQRILQTQMQFYGTNHYYNLDMYNEMDPTSDDPTYLTQASRAVYETIQSVDPYGVWVMQGWLFVYATSFWTSERMQAYLDGVPNEKMVLLDLYSEVVPGYTRTTENNQEDNPAFYFGKPFVYNMLHNFGGNLGLYGRMHILASEPPHVRSQTSDMQGVGLTMEGIEQNVILYEFMTEMSFRSDSLSVKEELYTWVDAFASRRYGQKNEEALRGWRKLVETVYTCTSTELRGVPKSLAVVRPTLSLLDTAWSRGNRSVGMNMTMEERLTTHDPHIFYPPFELVQAWRHLLHAASSSTNTQEQIDRHLTTYTYDLVDVGRQVLSNLLLPTYQAMMTAYHSSSLASFEQQSEFFLEIIQDLVRLLRTHNLFLLEPRLQSARSKGGSNLQLQHFYEFNARNQFTLWGPRGEISDYASKQYAGLVQSYYLPRWELFVTFVKEALEREEEFDEERFGKECLSMEEQWQWKRERYDAEVEGEAYEVAWEMFEKYVPFVEMTFMSVV